MAESVVSKCPHCSAKIEYDGKSDKMICEYCGSEIGIEEFLNSSKMKDVGDKTDDFKDPGNEQKFTSKEEDEFKVFTCPSCGGQLITDSNTAATTCVYCGNPAMVSERLSGVYRPEIVIPFKMNKEDAKSALKKLYAGKPLLPKSFKDENRIDSVTGIYVPFWLFDCDTNSTMTFKGTRVTHWSDSRYNYTKTDTYRLYRAGKMNFRNVPADGSKKTDDTLMESIEPFDVTKGEEFSAAYLAGYSADKYDVEPKDLKTRINTRILNSITDEFRKTTSGYTTVIREASNVKYSKDAVRYALFPVWMLNTTYKGTKYTFAMNGETGKAAGTLPVDMKKYWTYLLSFGFGIGAVIAALILFLL